MSVRILLNSAPESPRQIPPLLLRLVIKGTVDIGGKRQGGEKKDLNAVIVWRSAGPWTGFKCAMRWSVYRQRTITSLLST